MHLRITLSQLQLGLRHGDALGHGEDVGIRNGQHVNAVIKVPALDGACLARHVVRVLVGQVLTKPLGQKLELNLLGVVQALVDGGHDLATLFQQSNGGAHGSILVAVAYLHIGDAGQAAACVCTETQ